MYRKNGDLRVFSLSSHPQMGNKISEYLQIEPGKIELSTFSCGELYTRVLENIRGKHVYVLQTTTQNVNNNVMELLIAVDSIKRASAQSTNVIVPYFPYSRQDKKSASREPISARLVADLLEAAGTDRIITMDLHADQIQGYFNIPVDHLTSLPLFVNYFKNIVNDHKNDFVVVAPDTGRAKAAKKFADKLGVGLAIIHKSRPKHNVSEVMHVIGSVTEKSCILYDDIVDTGGSIKNAYDALKKNNALSVYLAATHPVFSGPAVERLNSCEFKEVVVINTIPLVDKPVKNITVLDASNLFAEVVKRNYEHSSISELYDI
jgi:ribose-phosphate pyrophosphokinase